MTAGLLGTAIRTSLSAAVMILAVLALRLRFQRKTPQRVFCLLWDIVLCRLLILAEIPSPVSIYRLLAQWPAPAGHTGTAVRMAVTADHGLVQRTLLQGTAAYAAPSPALPWGSLLAAAWMAGALVCAGWILGGHLRSRRVYAASLPARDPFVLDWLAQHGPRRPVQARCSDQIPAPLTYGILYPVVLLPSGMDFTDRERLSCVLAHEVTHIRRFDALRKALLAAALCLHWYNPLVWAMHQLACRDMELACDEAVIRSGADRRSYALALLSMEEERGRQPLSGSHFSANALQERIEAIMKHKHISLTALLAVLTVMSIATTVFAASAPEAPESNGSPVKEDTLFLTNSVTGETFCSVDEGITWLTEERYQAQFGDGWGDNWSVTWWTADKYQHWLEEEKAALQELIGTEAYTGGDGWFVWDQAKVDEAVALYESILEDIKNGALYSMEILDKDGNPVEDVSLGSDGPLMATCTSQFQIGISNGDAAACPPIDAAALLETFHPFGITGNEQDGLLYKGQPIRCLVDGASVGDTGYAIQYIYTNDTGTVDVHTLRSIIHNADGSYDTMGELIGMAAAGEQGFDQDLIDCSRPSAGSFQSTTAVSCGTMTPGGRTLQEIFAAYEPYGLTYTPVAGDSMGSLSYNGQSVGWFFDLKPDGGTFSYENPHGGSLKVYTVYTDGVLTGLAAE